MGRELVSDSQSHDGGRSDNGAALTSLTEQFYKHLPFYLLIGMTYDQYWNEDCCLVRYYRKAYQLQRDRDNEQSWLQGMYIYEALCDVAPILHAFAKKGTKPRPYISEPLPITLEELKERREREERNRYDKQKARIAVWAVKTNAKMAGQEVKRDG